MKQIWYFSSLLFIISIVLLVKDWNVDGFHFFKLQEYHFYFQSWISIGGIVFTSVMSIVTYIIYKNTQLRSLKYIPLSFVLLSISYAFVGYHASYCKVCSDLGLCAASHNYPLYLIIVAFIVFILIVIMFNRRLDIEEKTQMLFKFSLGIIIATIFLMIILFMSLEYLEIPDQIYYLESINNLQAFLFLFPVIIIVWVIIYFRNKYNISGVYLFITFLFALSFVPQITHIYICKECYIMECSEFYVFSGLAMLIVTALFLHSIHKQLQEDAKEI